MTKAVVRLLRVPVRDWMRLQEHTDALMREHRLILQQAHIGVPPELLELFNTVASAFPASAVPQLRAGVKAAYEAGETSADVDAAVTAEQARLTRSLHERLIDIDAYCRDGVLLTLPLEAEVVLLRGWVVEEVQRQLDGAVPRRYSGPVIG